MENASTEVSLSAHSGMVQEGACHIPLVILTKENMDADEPVPVVDLPHVRFIGGPISQGRTIRI